MVNIVARYNRLPDMARADIDLLAADIADFIRAELVNIDDSDMCELETLNAWYMHAGFITQQFRIMPPEWERSRDKYWDQDKVAPAIARMFRKNGGVAVCVALRLRGANTCKSQSEMSVRKTCLRE